MTTGPENKAPAEKAALPEPQIEKAEPSAPLEPKEKEAAVLAEIPQGSIVILERKVIEEKSHATGRRSTRIRYHPEPLPVTETLPRSRSKKKKQKINETDGAVVASQDQQAEAAAEKTGHDQVVEDETAELPKDDKKAERADVVMEDA